MMSKKEKCLYCGQVLFKKAIVDELGHTLVAKGRTDILELKGCEQYCMCPHCFSKNVLVHIKNPMGVNELKVSHLVL